MNSDTNDIRGKPLTKLASSDKRAWCQVANSNCDVIASEIPFSTNKISRWRDDRVEFLKTYWKIIIIKVIGIKYALRGFSIFVVFIKG